MNARLSATYVLHDVIVGRQSLSVTLNEQLSAIENPADKGLCQEIVYGTLRHYPSLQCTLVPFLKKKISDKNKPLEILLCAAIYQLYVLKLPDYAVINESVGVAQSIDFDWAKGFVNGVLRNMARVQPKVLKADKYSDHPVWLAKKIQSTYPKHSTQIFAENHRAAKVMLRVRRGSRDVYLRQLQQQGIAAEGHIDNKAAVVLLQSTTITDLPQFSDGGVTVQDANAQLAAGLLRIKWPIQSGMRILDACAAPGGKTAHIADMIADSCDAENASITLTAVDSAPARVALLNRTLARLQVAAKVVTADLQDVAAWHDGQPFDRILLDTPCSATGVIRKHPDILFHRHQSDIDDLIALQSRLLDACWALLKFGGRMLYATCSILPEENIEQIQSFLSRTPNAVVQPLGHSRAVKTDLGTLQFLPNQYGDGFFYALLEKKS